MLYEVITVNQIKFPESLPLERVRDRVITLLKQEKGRDTAVIRAYEAHAKAMESQDLEAACAPFGVTLRETGWTSDGKDTDVPRITSYNVCYTKLLRAASAYRRLTFS